MVGVAFKYGGHHWYGPIDATSRSGKRLWECSLCGLRDPAPVKKEYETRPCERGRYNDLYRQPNGEDWPPPWQKARE